VGRRPLPPKICAQSDPPPLKSARLQPICARGAPQNFGFSYNISATAEASDFKFGAQLEFAKHHPKITRRKNGAWPWTRGAPKIWSLRFNIYNMAELVTSNLVHSLRLPGPIEKSWRGLGLRELTKILGFPYNISATAEASKFKISTLLGFSKAHHKIPHRRKSVHVFGLGKLPNIWGSPLIFLQRPRWPLSVSGASCYTFYIHTDLHNIKS